jgi:hypothetical protein
MTSLKDLTNDQIHRIIAIKKKIEKLHSSIEKRVEKLHAKIESIVGVGPMPSPILVKKRLRRMSRAARAAIGAAVRARWAKIKGTAPAASDKPAAKKRRKMSAAVKAKIAAAARARWKKAKAAGKNAL